jgi:hypothetical protein
MIFVDRYLLYFRQRLITGSLLALLPLQPFFTEGSCGDQLLALPPFSGALTAPRPLCCVLVFSSLFIFQFFFLFLLQGGIVCPGAMLVYPRGCWGNTT